MAWTHFWDMHSGGKLKEPQQHILIEAPEDEARSVFFARFGHNAERVTCQCCGPDYSVSESETLEEATAFQRGCHFDEATECWLEIETAKFKPNRRYLTLAEYVTRPDVLVINAKGIQPGERAAEVPVQGWVSEWVGA